MTEKELYLHYQIINKKKTQQNDNQVFQYTGAREIWNFNLHLKNSNDWIRT